MTHSIEELIAMSNDGLNKLAGTLAGYTIVKGKNPEYEENPRREIFNIWDSRTKPNALFLYKNGIEILYTVKTDEEKFWTEVCKEYSTDATSAMELLDDIKESGYYFYVFPFTNSVVIAHRTKNLHGINGQRYLEFKDGEMSASLSKAITIAFILSKEESIANEIQFFKSNVSGQQS